MDFLPLIIAVVIAPILIYYIYKYSENSKKDSSVKTNGYTPPFGLTDKKIESLFIYKIYKVSTELLGGILFIVLAYFTEGQLQMVWIGLSLFSLCLGVYKWRKL